jgi:hypothetical protein
MTMTMTMTLTMMLMMMVMVMMTTVPIMEREGWVGLLMQFVKVFARAL